MNTAKPMSAPHTWPGWVARLWAPPAPRRASRPVAPAVPVLALPAEDEEQAAGCGWFDSSWELRQGLAVTEHADTPLVLADLPLSAWLQ